VTPGKSELRLRGRPEQRPAEFVEALALDDDAGGWALECFQIRNRDAHVFKTQRLNRLEAKHIADNRGREVRDRAGLEQIDVVGDVSKVLRLRVGAGTSIGNRVDPVSLGAIDFTRRQTIGPNN